MIAETLGHRVKIIGPDKVVPIIAWNDEGSPMVAGKLGLEDARFVAGRLTGRTTNYEVLPPAAPRKGRATSF